MIIWVALEQDIKGWLEDLGDKSVGDTASHFATSYANAISNATDPYFNAIIPPGKEAAIESAWNAAFAQMENSDSPPTPATWSQVDAATIAFFAGAQFQFATPHPPNTIPTGPNIITFPGAPGPLAVALNDALTSEDPGQVASKMVKGFQDHLKVVQGLYTGAITTPGGPVPTPVPWVGVS